MSHTNQKVPERKRDRQRQAMKHTRAVAVSCQRAAVNIAYFDVLVWRLSLQAGGCCAWMLDFVGMKLVRWKGESREVGVCEEVSALWAVAVSCLCRAVTIAYFDVLDERVMHLGGSLLWVDAGFAEFATEHSEAGRCRHVKMRPRQWKCRRDGPSLFRICESPGPSLIILASIEDFNAQGGSYCAQC